MKRFFLALLGIFAVYSMDARNEATDSIDSHELNEILVKGEKPLVKGLDGTMVVDLPYIVKDKPVNNILEALGYLPGVVNNNGLIGLAGANEVTIILNGELTNMPLQNLYQLLYTTPVDRLKSVEIMYTAPAKYHVSGAVINIILRTPTPLDGLQGQIRTGYNQAHYGSFGGGLAATYAVKDWTFDLNYGLSWAKSWNNEITASNHLYDSRRILIEDDMRRITENMASTIYASTSLKKLKLIYNGQITAGTKGYNLSSGTLGNFTNSYTYEKPINYHNITLHYSAPFRLTVGGDYTYFGEKQTQSLMHDADYLFGSHNKQQINKWHLYVDKEQQLGKWQLNYGVEYQRSVDNSSQINYPNATGGFSANSTEEVADAYIGLERSFDWGLSFDMSAKGEYFHNDYQHNWNFIPQLGATYYTTPVSIFQLNFTTERVYPSYWELHSRTSYINPYSKVIGNPALQPYLNYSGQFSYIFRQKYVATLYCLYGDKATVQLPYQSPDELSLIFQTININYKRSVGLNLNIPFRIGDYVTSTATANIFNQREKADNFHSISFDNHKWIFYGAINNSFRLSMDCPVSLSLDFTYLSPSIQGIADLSTIWKLDAGIKWKFGKKRCCELDLQAIDIFNHWSPTMTIIHAGQDYRMKVSDMTRNLKLTFVWRFNGFKPHSETTPDTSRFGTGN